MPGALTVGRRNMAQVRHELADVDVSTASWGLRRLRMRLFLLFSISKKGKGLKSYELTR